MTTKISSGLVVGCFLGLFGCLLVLIKKKSRTRYETHPALVNVGLGCRADFDYRLMQWSS